MTRRKAKPKPLGTIWKIPDALWQRIEPILSGEGRVRVGHIRPSRPGKREKRRPGRRKPRRLVVERTLGWLSKCRGILVRYE